ncbi:hypothetical protein ACFPRL_09250 [Pseudoclavibacter helvolus]
MLRRDRELRNQEPVEDDPEHDAEGQKHSTGPIVDSGRDACHRHGRFDAHCDLKHNREEERDGDLQAEHLPNDDADNDGQHSRNGQDMSN